MGFGRRGPCFVGTAANLVVVTVDGLKQGRAADPAGIIDIGRDIFGQAATVIAALAGNDGVRTPTGSGADCRTNASRRAKN